MFVQTIQSFIWVQTLVYEKLGKQTRHQHSAYTEEPTKRRARLPISGSQRGDHDKDQDGHAAIILQ
jgi:hypothetical protein